VLQAYAQLVEEGYAVGRHGSGTYVAAELPDELASVASADTGADARRRSSGVGAAARLSAYARRVREHTAGGVSWRLGRDGLPYDFRYGDPAFSDFPHATWCRVLARRARAATPRDLGYGAPGGAPALREALAEYLARSRGVACRPEQVVVVYGSQQAIDLVARVLVDPGTPVALEDPHYTGFRLALGAAGADVHAIPVDARGLPVEELAALPDVRLVCVTPSHQFPTGSILPLSRRLELLAWAERTDALVLEDDYDSEYRFDGRPVESLQGLDRSGRVLYAGTVSKVMFPALRVGYLVVPEAWVEPFLAVKALADTGSATLEQLALADFIREGFFERHLRRSRTRNAARRAAMLSAVAEFFGDEAVVSGANAGLHVVLWLPDVPARRVPEIRRRAREAGVGAYPVAGFYARPPRRAGLMLGYASLEEDAIREGVRRLASAVSSA
jgi:GntR family transcriptional regulator/MocR family aminotransferase